MKRTLYITALILLAVTQLNCAAARLAGYAVAPDYPAFNTDTTSLAGLQEPVGVHQDENGIWHIEAANEADLMFVTGYLQARDRMAQLDIFRHLAQGRVSELVGNVPFGGRSSVETDLFHRALDFEGRADTLFQAVSAEEKAVIQAFTDGINAWIAEGRLPLEHRLLGVEAVAPWKPTDSLSIYAMLMFNLSSNYNREIRRLAMACEAGLDASLRIWPTDIDFASYALPAEHQNDATFETAPSVVAEVRDELPALCAAAKEAKPVPAVETVRRSDALITIAAWAESFQQGWESSNNWVVSGRLTSSGKPILANDPHLPHMNPPIVWGVDQKGPDYRTAGFTIPGLHRVVFGHNGKLAWGATTNHVDRQDLALVKLSGSDGYEIDGEALSFEKREIAVSVRGEEAPAVYTVRYTKNGPLVGDMLPSLPARIPPTELRHAALGDALDIDAARELAYATAATEFVTAIRKMDSGCTSWVYADVDGNIGLESPCRLPVREGYDGTFPIAGWLSKYEWQGYVPKDRLPASANPSRGWLATANSRIVPAASFPTAYNNDPSAPNRYRRASQLIEDATSGGGRYLAYDAVIMQADTTESMWPKVREQLNAALCEPATPESNALCNWDGRMSPDSVAATQYVVLTNFLLDAALADELPANGARLWNFVQNIPMFEANAQWLWLRPADDEVWDSVTTTTRETKDDIIRVAFADSLKWMNERYGEHEEAHAWGEASRFRVRHLFAGNDGILGALLNTDYLPGSGAPTTLSKHQFFRSDREAFQPAVGPTVRFVIDMADPWGSVFMTAGGQSGWPSSPHYADLAGDWRLAKPRRITPDAAPDQNPNLRRITFEPGAATTNGDQK